MKISYLQFLSESTHRHEYNALVPGNDGSLVQAQLVIFPHWQGKHVIVAQHNPVNIKDDRVGSYVKLDPCDDVYKHLEPFEEWYGPQIHAGAADVINHIRGYS